MHAPDGFLNAGTAIGTGVISASAVGVSLRLTRDELQDRQIPLAGLSAAFIFAAQMVNFPVAAGTTGHLLGGALAAILLGPAMGSLVVTVVVVAQALLFADGGLTALGYNVLNMAVITAFGGYGAFVLLKRWLPSTVNGVSLAGGIAAGFSVVLSSLAFSVEWLFGATAPVTFTTVLSAMAGVHLLIGIGEGVITTLTLRTVLAVRPDLVHGAADLDAPPRRRVPARALLVGGLLASLLVAVGISQLSAPAPDGLERVAIDQGFDDSARQHPLADALFSDYATAGVGDQRVSLAIAGGVGTAVVFLVGTGLFLALRDRRRVDALRDVTPGSA